MRVLGVILVTCSLLLGIVSGAAAAPGLKVEQPTDGATVQGTTVTVKFQVSDLKIVPSNVPLSEAGRHPEVNRPGEGHLHFTLDLQPLVVWYQTDAYTFENVPPGQHRLMVELVNNDHSPLSPQVMTTIVFTVVPGSGPAIQSVPPATGQASQGTTAVGMLAIAGALICFSAGVRLRRSGALR